MSNNRIDETGNKYGRGRYNGKTVLFHNFIFNIQDKKKYINLGYYENFEEAVLARKNAELEYFNIYNRRNLQ